MHVICCSEAFDTLPYIAAAVLISLAYIVIYAALKEHIA